MVDPNAISETSPVTIGLAVLALGGIVIALRTLFGMKDELRSEFEGKYVLKETLDAKIDSLKQTAIHVHECIHRIEDKIDEVIDRNQRKDANDE